jgi:molybdopterin molybdotransferase
MIQPAEAERLIFEAMPRWESEPCPLASAHGRVLRADVVADRDLPPFDRATLDGYALRASSLASGIRDFKVEGIQPAGREQTVLGPGADACVEIMTGAVLPEGADCVVPYEEAAREGPAVLLTPGKAIAPGHAVHRRGGDHGRGQVIVPAGSRLSGREIAAAAACGAATLAVSRLPRIAVVATGDELVEVEAEAAPHEIRRSNDYALRASLSQAGFPGAERFHLRDRREEIEPRLRRILEEFDVVLLSGGVSRGRLDFLPEALDAQGVRRIFHGVAQRPGKPFWFGTGPRSVPVFALPGNPVSTYTCLHRYVLPALRRASALNSPPRRPAALGAPAPALAELASFLPVRLAGGPRGERLAVPVPTNTSGDFARLVGTDGFVELPPSPGPFPEGTLAPFWPWE